MRTLRFASLLFALLLLLSNCRSLDTKQGATLSTQAIEIALGAAQDIERQACNATAFQADPRAPILSCTTQAAAIGLTTAKHQQIAGKLAEAFAVQRKIAIVLQAWRAGDPAPTDLPALFTVVHDTLDVVQAIAPSAAIASIAEKVRAVLDKIDQLRKALGGVVPVEVQ